MGLIQRFSSLKSKRPGLWWSLVMILSVLTLGGALLIGYMTAVLLHSPALDPAKSILTWLLATNTTQVHQLVVLFDDLGSRRPKRQLQSPVRS